MTIRSDIGCGRVILLILARDMLLRGGAGFGALALDYLLGDNPLRDCSMEAAPQSPLAPNRSTSRPRRRASSFCSWKAAPATSICSIPSRCSTAGGPAAADSFGKVITPMGEVGAPLLASPRRWEQHGQCGTWVSDWLPHIAECVDDLAVMRSCWADGINHSAGVCQMNTGSILAGRPSLGCWVTYGLGTENQNLPAFVVMQDSSRQVSQRPAQLGQPASCRPSTRALAFEAASEPIPNLDPPAGRRPRPAARQARSARPAQPRTSRRPRPQQTELDARIASYELAFRMQAAGSGGRRPGPAKPRRRNGSTASTSKRTADFGRQCLLARRLVERGVRFVQLYHGAGSNAGTHTATSNRTTRQLCRPVDKPIAGLLAGPETARPARDDAGDLGRRVRPDADVARSGDGRDHNPYGFTMWLAGGGVKGGQVIGSTDDFGLHAVEDRLHVHDLHATILHLLGLDHMRLIYRYKGRPERATVNEGEAFVRITG